MQEEEIEVREGEGCRVDRTHRDDGYLSSRVKSLYRKAPSGFRKA